jgi:hypothetical protein
VYKLAYFTALLLTFCTACSQAPKNPMPTLTTAQTQWLGERIFANECNLKIPCLTSWNAGEDFPSLGIGHFIWYRSGQQEAFVESFPALLSFYEAEGIPLPQWLEELPGHHSPWQSRAEFLADQGGERLQSLRSFLYDSRDVQVKFIIRRMQTSLPSLLANSKKPDQIQSLFYEIAAANAPLGMYALIDYVNFKGEGTELSERYAGEGWGLLQVLETLSNARDQSPLMPQFAAAARTVLARRIANSPSERREQRWLEGWNNRTYTYENLP